ncbi:hypothetical protein [Chlorobium sp. KB01]|uniref:hypothetical protein n=1 Tax=Chlorobium sp. KB01 TaxID=1917528 RepID=UPI0013014C74|nr:hypothetical protein [Chlorobium sp. KB01]
MERPQTANFGLSGDGLSPVIGVARYLHINSEVKSDGDSLINGVVPVAVFLDIILTI